MQLPLGQSLLRDVTSDRGGAHDTTGVVTNGGDRQRDVDDPTILGHSLRREMFDSLPAGDAFEDVRDLVLALRWGQLRYRMADDLLGSVAIHGLRARIPGLDQALEALSEDRVLRGFDDRGEVPGERVPGIAPRVGVRHPRFASLAIVNRFQGRVRLDSVEVTRVGWTARTQMGRRSVLPSVLCGPGIDLLEQRAGSGGRSL